MTTYGNAYDTPTVTTGAAGIESDSTEFDSNRDAAAQAARQTGQTAKEQASQVAQNAAAQTSAVAGTAKEQASQVAGTAADQARELAAQARGELTTQASQQSDRAVSTLRSLSDELRSMADNGGQSGMATTVVQQVSSQMDNVAGYLERREPGELVDDLRDLARRRPGAFLLGAALTGVIAGRLMKGAKSAAQDESASQRTDARLASIEGEDYAGVDETYSTYGAGNAYAGSAYGTPGAVPPGAMPGPIVQPGYPGTAQ